MLSALRCQRPTQAGRTPLRHVGRCSISIMSKFFLPGSLANAARHFLCQAPAQSDDGMAADHAAAGGSRSSFWRNHAVGTFKSRPKRMVLISPDCAAA